LRYLCKLNAKLLPILDAKSPEYSSVDKYSPVRYRDIENVSLNISDITRV